MIIFTDSSPNETLSNKCSNMHALEIFPRDCGTIGNVVDRGSRNSCSCFVNRCENIAGGYFDQGSFQIHLHAHWAAPESLVARNLLMEIVLGSAGFRVLKPRGKTDPFVKFFLRSQISEDELACTYGFHYKARDISPVARRDELIPKNCGSRSRPNRANLTKACKGNGITRLCRIYGP